MPSRLVDRLSSLLALTLLMLGTQAAHAAPASIAGTWFGNDDRGIIRIAPCGNFMCATLIGPGPATDKSAGPFYDTHNSNRALRTRPLIGLVLLPDGVPEQDHWRGNIYSPDDGRSFPATMIALPDGTLKVRGCWGFICRTQIWHSAH